MRTSANRQYRREQPSLPRQRRVPYRVDAAMDPMQPTRHDPHPDRVFTNSQAAQLTDRDHSVLLLGDPGNPKIALGDYPAHIPG